MGSIIIKAFFTLTLRAWDISVLIVWYTIYGIYIHTIYCIYFYHTENTDGERKGRQVPWSHTPVIRVRADDIRVPRREEVAPQLLTFDEVEDEEEE